MKKVLICLFVVLLLTGCNGVWMNAEFSQLLDKTAALSAATAVDAKAGALTPQQMTTALDEQAKIWQHFRNARDGKSND